MRFEAAPAGPYSTTTSVGCEWPSTVPATFASPAFTSPAPMVVAFGGVVIRPIRPTFASVNQTFPSGPGVTPKSPTPSGSGKPSISPPVVIRPISSGPREPERAVGSGRDLARVHFFRQRERPL